MKLALILFGCLNIFIAGYATAALIAGNRNRAKRIAQARAHLRAAECELSNLRQLVNATRAERGMSPIARGNEEGNEWLN